MKRRFHLHFNIVIIVLAALFFLGTAKNADAEPIVYGGVIADALGSSANLKVKGQDVKIAHSTYRQALAALYPQLTLTGRLERYENLDEQSQDIESVNNELVGGVSSWRSMASLSGQYDISSWYKKRYETLYYEQLREAVVFDCETESKKLARDVTDLFGRLAEGQIRLKYGTEIINSLKELVDLRNKALVGGEASQEDALKAASDLETAEKERTMLIKEFRENLEALNSYTAKAYAVTDEMESLVVESSALSIEPAKHQIEAAPEIKAQRKELEALQIKARSTFNNYMPDVSLYGRYDYYGNDSDNLNNAFEDFGESGYSAGLMLSLPIFDGGTRKWARIQASHEIKRQEEKIKATIEEKKREARADYAGYSELARALEHYRKLAAQFGNLRAISGKAFDLGQRSRADVLEMERDYLQIERDLKVTEVSLAIYQKRLAIESDYDNFMREFYGNWSCKY